MIDAKSSDRAIGFDHVRFSESDARAELKRPGFAHGGNLAERWRWIRRIRAGSEVAVSCQHVDVVGQVETLRQPFELNAAAEVKRATETEVEIEKIAPVAGVTWDKRSIDNRPTGRALNRRDARGDVEWPCRICLEHCAQLKTVCQMLDQRCGDLIR
jgi:hypothetical protein